MINEITEKLYAEGPRDTLYHYTTFKGLIGIVENHALWASDIRYMNDSAELHHTANLIKKEIDRRINEGHDNPVLLHDFFNWISHRIISGHLLFTASFRSDGNLLSQWRGYSSVGKGVSLGFNPEYLTNLCRAQNFQIGHCIYEPSKQQALIARLIDAIEKLSSQEEFQTHESDVLRIAAILKHPAFEEEDEWRIVSLVNADAPDSHIKFREGTSMIVPFTEFNFQISGQQRLELEHVFLGPTPNINNSMNSIELFFHKYQAMPKRGIEYCRIPFRRK